METKTLKVREGTDFLWDQICDLPYFRGLLRAVESRFYSDVELEEPVLDLGCGDGHFAERTFAGKVNVGIDPWVGPVHLAGERGNYSLVINGNGDRMPFETGTFATCISNSVLEHIPDLDSVLAETARVLKPGGKFVFCVPNQNFLANLSVSNFFDRIGLRPLGNAYRAFFNRISRHHHCDSPEVWQARLEKAGFSVERWWHYFSPQATHVLEWGHYLGVPTVFNHFVFRRWILVPEHWNLSLTHSLIKKHYEKSPLHPQGSYTFYIVRRV